MEKLSSLIISLNKPMRYFSCIILCMITCMAFSTTWKVDKKSALSIQQVIDKCLEGDTVQVMPGVYFEKNLIIQKPIVLKGIDYPVLDGEGKYQIISIKSSNVTVDGFIIQHSSKSIL